MRRRLTSTEHAVAELAARGRTNDEIASTLYLSGKTVEWNLTKIYRALGVRSRTELAALWAVEPPEGPGETPDDACNSRFAGRSAPAGARGLIKEGNT